MKIDKCFAGYVIRRGNQYFAFLLDGYRSSWSKRFYEARRFEDQASAAVYLAELQHRAKLRRRERKAGENGD